MDDFHQPGRNGVHIDHCGNWGKPVISGDFFVCLASNSIYDPATTPVVDMPTITRSTYEIATSAGSAVNSWHYLHGDVTPTPKSKQGLIEKCVERNQELWRTGNSGLELDLQRTCEFYVDYHLSLRDGTRRSVGEEQAIGEYAAQWFQTWRAILRATYGSISDVCSDLFLAAHRGFSSGHPWPLYTALAELGAAATVVYATVVLSRIVFHYTYNCIGRLFGYTNKSITLQHAYETPITEARAFHHALSVAKEPTRSVTEIVLEHGRIAFDTDGPYYPANINGQEVVIRLNPNVIVAMTSLTKPVPPANETAGKEAALTTSRAPREAAMPPSQLMVKYEGRVIGFATRIGPDTLLLTQHEIDTMRACTGPLFLATANAEIPLSKIEQTGDFPNGSDLAAIKLGTGFFSALSCKVATLSVPVQGPATIHTLDDLGRPVLAWGALERDPAHSGILRHTCWTKPGTSGAPVWQNGRIVAVHTGTNPDKTTNLATSTRYVSAYLGLGEKETYWADDSYDRDDNRDHLIEQVEELERKYRFGDSKDLGLAEEADALWTDIRDSRYQEIITSKEEMVERLERLNAGTALQHEIMERLYGQAGTRNMSKKNARKYGLETGDIKGPSTSTSATTLGKMGKSTLKGVASKSSAVLPPSEAPKTEEKVASLPTTAQIDAMVAAAVSKALMEKQSTPSDKPSSSVSRPAEPAPSSPHSSIKPKGLYRPQVADSILSRKASKGPSKTTQ